MTLSIRDLVETLRFHPVGRVLTETHRVYIKVNIVTRHRASHIYPDTIEFPAIQQRSGTIDSVCTRCDLGSRAHSAGNDPLYLLTKGTVRTSIQNMKDPSKIKNCGNGRSGSKRQLGTGGFRTTLDGLRKSDIRRLARRAGVKRISETFYDVALKELESYLKDILPEIIVYIEHARRTTVMPIDVLRALKRRGQTLYGFWPGAESLAGILAPRYKRIGNICRPLIRPVISPVKAYAPEREPTSKELPAISAGKLQALQEAIATFFLQEHIDSCSIDSLIAHVRQQQGTTVNEVVAVVGALEEENRLMCRDGTVWLI